MTGYFSWSPTFGAGELNETRLVTGGVENAVFLARYNPDGTLAWAKQSQSTSDGRGAALAAFRRSCENPKESVGPLTITHSDWRAPCAAARKVGAGDQAAARVFFERWFRPFRIAGGKSNLRGTTNRGTAGKQDSQSDDSSQDA